MAGRDGGRSARERETHRCARQRRAAGRGRICGPALCHRVVNMLTLHALNRTFGLRPRSADGLLDIFTFPLLHANLNHLLSNALPLIIFGFLVFLSGLRVFLTALAFSWLGSGADRLADRRRRDHRGRLRAGFRIVRLPPGPWLLQPQLAADPPGRGAVYGLRQHPAWGCCPSWAGSSPGRRTSAARPAASSPRRPRHGPLPVLAAPANTPKRRPPRRGPASALRSVAQGELSVSLRKAWRRGSPP